MPTRPNSLSLNTTLLPKPAFEFESNCATATDTAHYLPLYSLYRNKYHQNHLHSFRQLFHLLPFSHNNLSNLLTFSLLFSRITLPLLFYYFSFALSFATSNATATFANSQQDNYGPISDKSEAKQLYCQQCLLDCSGVTIDSAAHMKPISDIPFDNTGTSASGITDDANTNQQPIFDSQFEHSDSTSSSHKTIFNLNCKCKSVFDSRKLTFTCKNVSSAQAKSTTTTADNRNNNHSSKSSPSFLEARAVAEANSSTNRTDLNSTRHILQRTRG